MERLTKRNSLGIAVYKHPFECDRCGETIYRIGDDGNGSPTDKLADYEDAEEQGLLLRLRCNVGDTVYTVSENGVFSYVIQGFQFFNNEIYVLCGYKAVIEMEKCFFCIEEAESKLAEMRGEQHGR